MASSGRLDEALPLFRKVFAADSNWVTLTRRLPGCGLLPQEPRILEKILSVAP